MICSSCPETSEMEDGSFFLLEMLHVWAILSSLCNFTSFLAFLNNETQKSIKNNKGIIPFFPYYTVLLRQLVEQVPECSVWYACTLLASLGISRVQFLPSWLGKWIYHFSTEEAPSRVMVAPRPWSPSKRVISSGRHNSKNACTWCSVSKMTTSGCTDPILWTMKYSTICSVFWGHLSFLFPWPMKTLALKDWHCTVILLWQRMGHQFDRHLGVIYLGAAPPSGHAPLSLIPVSFVLIKSIKTTTKKYSWAYLGMGLQNF